MDRKNIKIYFCGSIRGGRSYREIYEELILYLKNFGTVLTEHVAEEKILTDLHLTDEEIYRRDIDWLDQSDFIVAEVSTPSLGVGVELARAICHNKKILCLSQADKHQDLSAMIKGCPELLISVYSDIAEAQSAIRNFLN